MSRRRKLLGLLLAMLLLGGAWAWFFLPAPPASPVELKLDWFAMGGTSGPSAVIRITNHSATGYRWNVQTLVQSNGVWKRAARQPTANPSTSHVPGHEWSGINVPISDEGRRWKVELSCRRYDTALENAIQRACRFLHVPVPFKDSRKPVIKAELEFEK